MEQYSSLTTDVIIIMAYSEEQSVHVIYKKNPASFDTLLSLLSKFSPVVATFVWDLEAPGKY